MVWRERERGVVRVDPLYTMVGLTTMQLQLELETEALESATELVLLDIVTIRFFFLGVHNHY
jgi:hypothetical protein